MKAVNKTNRRRSMSFAYMSASSNIIGATICTGNILTLISLKLGAQEIFLGLLSFATFAPYLFGVLSMSAVERIGKRKVLLIWKSVAVLLAIPFLFLPMFVRILPSYVCLGILMATVFFKAAADSIAGQGWFPILQDIVPTRLTGRFFARMRVSWQSAGFITLLAASFFLKNDPQWWKFEMLFIIAIIAFTASCLCIIPIHENPPAHPKPAKIKIWKRFVDVTTNSHLRPLIGYIIFYMIAITMPLQFQIKMLKELGYSDGFVLLANSLIPLGAILTLKFWGRLADRFGNRSIFSISHVGMIVVTITWLLVENSPTGTAVICTLYFLNSVFNSGNGIALTRYMLHAVPSNKQNQINIMNMISIFSMAIGPVIGGLLLWLTKNWTFHCGALSMNNYHLLFVISACLFFVPHTLRRKLKIRKDTSTSDVLAIVSRPVRGIMGTFIRIKKKNHDKI